MASDPFGPDVRKRSEAVRLAMTLLLAALGVFFVSSIIAYLIIRIQNPPQADGRSLPLQMPWMLSISTVFLLGSSVTLLLALGYVRRERQVMFRRMILATAVLALAFLAVQTVGLAELLEQHRQYSSAKMHLYGLIFVLVVVHGFHVVGGLVPLAMVTKRAIEGRYDHEYHAGVEYFSLYWHFLDAVWLAMFAAFLVLR